jgi:hypothetical protein
MDIVDPSLPQQIVRAALLGNAPVVALVGDRVRGSHAVDADATDPTYPGLVFAYSGGDTIRSGVYADLTYGLTCYSRVSASEALAVYGAAANVLHSERLVLDGVAARVVAHETARPRIGWDEAHRAHYAVGRWRIQVLDVE